MTEITLGVAIFTLIVMFLVALILVARSKLIPSGDIIININNDEDKRLVVEPLRARADDRDAGRAPAVLGTLRQDGELRATARRDRALDRFPERRSAGSGHLVPRAERLQQAICAGAL